MGDVIIGLGGVGKVVLMKMRKMLVEEYGSLPDTVRFLHVDTFAENLSESGQDFVTEVLGQDLTLTPTERIILSEGLPLPPYAASLSAHPHVREWFPTGLPVQVNFAQGAGGTRPYGRLAFHHKVHEFRRRLNHLLARLAGSANIYLVSSLFGGTGSGILMDVCYAVRDEQKRLSTEGELMGFFVIGATDPNDVMRGNCYASLMELEYYMTQHVLTTLDEETDAQLGVDLIDRPHPFETRYPVAGVPEVVSTEAPVDTCYLFGTGNTARTLMRSELEAVVARRICLELTSGVGGPLQAKRVDIKSSTMAYYAPDRLQQRAKSFFATGSAVIEFPAPRLMSALGGSFAAYCIQVLLREHAPGFSDLKGALKTCLEHQLGMSVTEHALRRVFEQQDSRTMSHIAAAERQAWLNDLLSKIQDAAFDAESIYSEAETVVHRAVGAMQLNGTYALAMTRKMDEIWAQVEPALHALIVGYTLESTIGPDHTCQFIERLVQEHLVNDQRAFHDARGSAERAMFKARERLDRRLRKIRADLMYRKELGRHARWLCTKELGVFMAQGIRRALYSAMEAFIHRLIDTLERRQQQIVQHVRTLREIKDQLTAEHRTICENLIAWIDAETAVGQPLFGDLRHHLSHLLEQTEPDRLDRVIQTLLSQYNAPESFDGSLHVRAENTLTACGPVFERVQSDPHLFAIALFQRCREQFSMLNGVNICDLIVRQLSPRECDELFVEKMRQAEWPLAILTNDATLDHDPRLCEKRWIGVPNTIDLQAHGIWQGVLSHYDAGSERFNAIGQPYRMVLASETSVFCLRNLAVVSDYSKSYRRLDLADRKKRHTHRQIAYPDPLPPDPRLTDLHLRAERGALLGKVLNVLKQVEDSRTLKPAIYLYSVEPRTGFQNNTYLCPGWNEVVPTLRDAQVRKELEYDTTETTPLECLEHEIHQQALQAQTREQKAILLGSIRAYLEEKLTRMGGNDSERHPAYQRDIRLFGDFVNTYNLGSLTIVEAEGVSV